MSKTTLFVIIGAAILAVGAFGAITATVIVDDEGGGPQVVQLVAQPTLPPVPGRGDQPYGQGDGHGGRGFGPGGGSGPGQLPGLDDLRNCLEQHGLGDQGALPDLRTMRDALKACRGSLPGSTLQP